MGLPVSLAPAAAAPRSGRLPPEPVPMHRSTTLTFALAFALASALGAARADTPAGKTAAEAGKLEDVVVTAQRREESAQSVGIALSVLSNQALKDGDVEKVNDLANVTPSLEVEPAFSSGQPQFRLRGVGFIDYTSNNTSAVGVSVDGVPVRFPIQTQGQIFDLSRVEVLRGPQGTLYGLNTTGGAVNFISNRPTKDLQGGVDVSYGSHNAFTAEGFVSGAFAEEFRGRLSVATEQGGAWQRNRLTGQALGDKSKSALRLQLEWDAASNTNLRLTVYGSQDQSEAYGTQLIAPFIPSPYSPTPVGPVLPADSSPYATGWSLSPAFAQTVGIAPNSKPGVDNWNNGASLDVNVDVGAAKLTSISAYDKFVRRELNDWDATQYFESDIYFRDDVEVFSEELRLASTGTGPLSWVTGVYYADDKLREKFYGDFTDIYGASALTTYEQKSKSLGVFAQGTYAFTDRLKGVLGLRPDHETRDLIGLETIFGGGVVPPGAISQSISSSEVSGKAELDFELEKGALLYGSISRGVKSGGFTAHNLTAASPPFAPEKLLAYELGIKADVTPALRVNGALFYYDYTDQQVLSKFLTATGYIGSFINAPKSRIDGGEIELDWVPGGGFELSQYLGYKTGKYTASVLNSAGADFNGKDLDFPKLSYGGQFAYGLNAGQFRVKAEVNYSYHDKYDQAFLLENVDTSGNVIGEPQFQIDSYWLANASIELAPATGRTWTVAIWCHNLTDQKYFVTKNFFLTSPTPPVFSNNIGAAGQPTTFGLRATIAF
jgi:iron complex outermembrane recepter protein